MCLLDLTWLFIAGNEEPIAAAVDSHCIASHVYSGFAISFRSQPLPSGWGAQQAPNDLDENWRPRCGCLSLTNSSHYLSLDNFTMRTEGVNMCVISIHLMAIDNQPWHFIISSTLHKCHSICIISCQIISCLMAYHAMSFHLHSSIWQGNPVLASGRVPRLGLLVENILSFGLLERNILISCWHFTSDKNLMNI